MTWSRNCRLFYGEQVLGAYLPVDRISSVIFNELGWRGWVSMELFNSSMEHTDSQVPSQHAERGFRSWQKLAADFPAILKGRPTEEEMTQARGAREQMEANELEAVRIKEAAAALKAEQESPKEATFGEKAANRKGAH
jgi:4-hydroxyphenylpyruvate dioxygenase